MADFAPELNFQIDGVEAVPYAASPMLAFKLRITQAPKRARSIHSVLLRCQIRIDPARRRYSADEQRQLVELFGEPNRWGQTVRPMLWTHVNQNVGAFSDEILVDLQAPCTYDFNVAIGKYFHALQDGQVPLTLLFSGTIFYAGEDGTLQVAQIPWEKEAAYRLPVETWKRMMDLYYPNTVPLSLHRDVFDRLYQYKSSRMMTTWEQAVGSLLDNASEPSSRTAPGAKP